MTEKNLVTAIHDALHDEMAADDRVVVLGEDVGARGGVFRVTQGFLEEFGEARVIDTPLAEGAIVGVAVGMALHGLLPVAEIEFADFIHPTSAVHFAYARDILATVPTPASVALFGLSALALLAARRHRRA